MPNLGGERAIGELIRDENAPHGELLLQSTHELEITIHLTPLTIQLITIRQEPTYLLALTIAKPIENVQNSSGKSLVGGEGGNPLENQQDPSNLLKLSKRENKVSGEAPSTH